MGSDHCPGPDVEGAILAAREYPDVDIVLVGIESAIQGELAKYDTAGLKLEIVHADEVVAMEDKPSKVVRSKPQSSMAVGMRLVKDGKADAFVTAGNTGAVLAYATLHVLKRIQKVMRPTFPGIIPVPGHQFILSDSGANADCRPEWLVQFGIMCSAYAELVLGRNNPLVALLSNGEEEGKGNELVHRAGELLAASDLNFIGNIEPKDALNGKADVVLADGFTGNVVLKTMEAVSSVMFDFLRAELTSDLRSKLGAALAKPAFRRIYYQIDPFEIGGAPLLGVNGVVIVGHGRTNAKGMKNAINQARKAVAQDVVRVIRERMAAYQETPSPEHTEGT
jgi:glycerol-3-phosphate acyltransferase PlsX